LPSEALAQEGGDFMSFRDKMMDYLGKDRRRSIRVEELDETIYVSPISVLEYGKIKTISGNDPGAQNVWTVIEKAEDEAGNKLLSAEDKPFVEKMPMLTITKIANLAMGVEDIETVKKSSEKTPS
jgi:hypothetical protein